jgi:hypothetical protein
MEVFMEKMVPSVAVGDKVVTKRVSNFDPVYRGEVRETQVQDRFEDSDCQYHPLGYAVFEVAAGRPTRSRWFDRLVVEEA